VLTSTLLDGRYVTTDGDCYELVTATPDQAGEMHSRLAWRGTPLRPAQRARLAIRRCRHPDSYPTRSHVVLSVACRFPPESTPIRKERALSASSRRAQPTGLASSPATTRSVLKTHGRLCEPSPLGIVPFARTWSSDPRTARSRKP